jgi:peptidyl-tRNA hydrolase
MTETPESFTKNLETTGTTETTETTGTMETTESNKYVMYILVNTDIKMQPGKSHSQVGHVVGVITDEIIRNAYELPTEESMRDFLNYKKWMSNNEYTKVVLKATNDELKKLIRETTETPGIKFKYIEDTYRSEDINITVVGFFPRNDLKGMMSGYKLM